MRIAVAVVAAMVDADEQDHVELVRIDENRRFAVSGISSVGRYVLAPELHITVVVACDIDTGVLHGTVRPARVTTDFPNDLVLDGSVYLAIDVQSIRRGCCFRKTLVSIADPGIHSETMLLKRGDIDMSSTPRTTRFPISLRSTQFTPRSDKSVLPAARDQIVRSRNP